MPLLGLDCPWHRAGRCAARDTALLLALVAFPRERSVEIVIIAVLVLLQVFIFFALEVRNLELARFLVAASPPQAQKLSARGTSRRQNRTKHKHVRGHVRI